MSSAAVPASRTNAWLMPGILLLSLAIFLIDYLTPLGYSLSPLYAIPLLLTARSRQQRLPLTIAAFGTALVIFRLFLGTRGAVIPPVIFRRSVGIAVLWIISVLLVQCIRVEEESRGRSDDALRGAHDRLRSFIDANIVGVTVAKASGAVVEANDYYLRAVGYTREELEKGLVDWRALTPPEWLAADERALQELREWGHCTPYEKEYVRRDGSRVPVFLSDAVLPGPKGEIVAFVLDITKRKQAEEANQATEERLRLFIDHAPASLAMFDREMRYLSVSRRWMNDYGVGERDLRGLSHYDVFPEIDDRWKAIHQRALAGEVVHDDNDRLDRLDGSALWLRWEVRPWHDAVGKVGGIVVFSEDITERKLAEEARRETESKFRLLFTSMSEAVLIAEIIRDDAGKPCDFRRLEANPAYLHQTGLPAESVVRQTVLEAFPSLEPFWIERFGQVVLTGEPIRFEDYNRHTDRNYDVAAFAMGGNRFGVVFTDVTERKRSEQKIELITERLALATRAAHLGIWDWDIVNNQLVWDDRMYELYGVRKEAFGGAYEAWVNGLHPDDRAESEKTSRRLLRGAGSEYESEFRVVWPDGSVRHLTAHGVIIRDESGKPLRLIGVNNDITARKQAEEALRQSEDQWKSAFRAAPIPFGLSLQDGRIVDVNDAYTRLFGYSREEIIGRTSADFGLYTSLSSRATMFQLLQRDRKIDDFETTVKTKSGKLLTVGITSTFISLQGKSHILGTIVDVTERKRAEAEIRRLHEDLERHAEELDQRVRERTVQLEAANNELEAFSYSVSHDLRAPLRAIHGFARILTEDHGDKLDAEGRRVLEVVSGEASRMGQLIDDLLQFARLGRQPLRKSVTDMTALAQEIYERLRAQTPPGRSIDFVFEPLPSVPADPALLRQVWFNLLDNAWKFTRHREHARIVLSGSIQEREAIYSVADNGAGFDMRYAGKLFDVFQRLHALDEFEGTGVGLALVQQVVRRHGGRVWAEGVVDGGATFSFSLPLSGAAIERRKESE